MALYFAVNAVLMSCLGTRYLAPLNGRAAESFIATNALYFGEPMYVTHSDAGATQAIRFPAT